MTFSPVPKPEFKRRAPKRVTRNNFSKKVIAEIHERDRGVCQLCGRGNMLEVHHCKFKSQGGRGVVSNGLLLCHLCHHKAHSNYDLAESLRERMIDMYGVEYYKDRWDLNG